jgi:chromosome segregation ATPase
MPLLHKRFVRCVQSLQNPLEANVLAKIKTQMKHTFILLVLLAYGLISLSQTTRADSLKELNDLKALKSQLIDKSTILLAKIGQEQTWIDSCTKKLKEVKDQAAQLKQNASGKKKKALEQNEKELEQLNKNINEILERQADSKELLDKVNKLVKELDSKINGLSKSLG